MAKSHPENGIGVSLVYLPLTKGGSNRQAASPPDRGKVRIITGILQISRKTAFAFDRLGPFPLQVPPHSPAGAFPQMPPAQPMEFAGGPYAADSLSAAPISSASVPH